MELNQGRLKKLMQNTDKTFEQYKQHPNSHDYAQAYEQAKTELDEYLISVRQSNHSSPS